jgi:Zn-dependent oligopeptidase
LSKTKAASRARAPLAEFAVRTVVLLPLLALFRTEEESMGRYFKTCPVLIQKFLFRVCHSLYGLSFSKEIQPRSQYVVTVKEFTCQQKE